ncbi:1-(5-phosphoribosyl)-5-[(5-phosphoribosylamino)methylideneamino]imidazole-4-carboxamide isomerase [Candidatus Auribacterota bacterium]
MIIIPAVDIKNGKCVRLFQGKADRETIYSENPSEFALKWEKDGATYLHVVDLDGAFLGETQNIDVIKEIIKRRERIKIEVGGGIRDIETIQVYLDLGVNRVILGTKALDEKFLKEAVRKFAEKIVVGIDAKDGFVVTEGWVKKTEFKSVELVKMVEDLGVQRIIYTDITYDGTLKGPNLKGMEEVLNLSQIAVIASGGISKKQDLLDLKNLNKENLEGIIIGKALYTGNIDLKEVFTTFQNS